MTIDLWIGFTYLIFGLGLWKFAELMYQILFVHMPRV